MPHRVLTLVCCSLIYQQAVAQISTVAISGAPAAGVSGAVFDTFDTVYLNDTGEIAFIGSLETGIGGVTIDDNEGVWQSSGGANSIITRTGVGNVPSAAGSDFLTFRAVAIDSQGDLVVRAALDNAAVGTTEGVWRYSGTSGTLLERTGTDESPGIPNTVLDLIDVTPATEPNGKVAFRGSVDGPGINSSNNRAVWSYTGTTGTLVARESQSVPQASGTFDNFGSPRINSNNQMAVLGVVDSTFNDYVGMWRYTGTSGEVLAQTKLLGDVPEIPAAQFSQISNAPAINSSGQITFKASFFSGSIPVTEGVFLYTGTSGSLLLRKDQGGVPSIPNAEVVVLDDPQINDAGQVLVGAELMTGVGGVTSDNSAGLWLVDNGGSLVARSGSGGVPDLPSANFDSFDTYKLNNAGQIALAASLQTGIGGVDATNDQGLWILDPQGQSQLIARKGDTLAGLTIDSLDFYHDTLGQTGFNDAGQLVFQAEFTNGDSGLFLFGPYAADFDNDGDVDSNDLADWQSAYGQTADGDADFDGDTDGKDFLIWQREFGSGVTLLEVFAKVPEPATASLFLLGLWSLRCYSRRRHCR